MPRSYLSVKPSRSESTTPQSAPKGRAIYDDRDNDYIRSYDRRSNERHNRTEDGEYDQTLDQQPLDPIARSGDLSGQ